MRMTSGNKMLDRNGTNLVIWLTEQLGPISKHQFPSSLPIPFDLQHAIATDSAGTVHLFQCSRATVLFHTFFDSRLRRTISKQYLSYRLCKNAGISVNTVWLLSLGQNWHQARLFFSAVFSHGPESERSFQDELHSSHSGSFHWIPHSIHWDQIFLMTSRNCKMLSSASNKLKLF